MLETTSQSFESNPSACWPRPVAFGAIAVVVATAGWVGYRMLDPVGAERVGGLTCYSTGTPGTSPGAITTPHLEVKPGKKVIVRSIELLGSVNFRLVDAGVQHVVGGIGVEHFPVRTEGTDAEAAWRGLAELPAVLGGGATESAIIAVEPVDRGAESSFDGVRIAYRSAWGIPYSVELPMGFEAKPHCLLDDEGEE